MDKFSLLLNLNFESKRKGVKCPLEVFSNALKIHKSKSHLRHKSELCHELITFKIVLQILGKKHKVMNLFSESYLVPETFKKYFQCLCE